MEPTFSLDSLIQFVADHAYQENIVSENESRTNLEQNLVGIYDLQEIVSPTGESFIQPLSAGCGLRLTTDGYILTAYHVIETAHRVILGENREPGRPNYVGIQDQQRYISPLDPSFLVIDREHDVALIKTYCPEVGEPIPFNINWDELRLFQQLISVRFDHNSGKSEQSSGRILKRTKSVHPINDEQKNITDLFVTSAPVYQGNSGGIFIDDRGSLAGTISCARFPKNRTTGEYYLSYGAKIEYGLRLIGMTLGAILDIGLGEQS